MIPLPVLPWGDIRRAILQIRSGYNYGLPPEGRAHQKAKAGRSRGLIADGAFPLFNRAFDERLAAHKRQNVAEAGPKRPGSRAEWRTDGDGGEAT